MTTAPPRAGRGGRPRDPQLDGKIVTVARDLLAEYGLVGYTADAIAARARVGKASIFRRWDSMDDLLVDVVRELGVRDVDHGEGPGTVRDDLTRVLHAATTGYTAAAEIALLGRVGRSPELQVAYMAGPATRLVRAINTAEIRARRRHEPQWSSVEPILAAALLLQHEYAVHGEQSTLRQVARVVELVALPGLGYGIAVSA